MEYCAMVWQLNKLFLQKTKEDDAVSETGR
jgi:hypothetical protein